MSKEFTMSETEVLTRWANFPLDALGPFDRETLKLAASLLEQRQSARDAALEATIPDPKYTGALYAAYSASPTTDWNTTEEAICDALAMGGIRAHPGDGVSMVAQLIWAQMKRADDQRQSARDAALEAVREFARSILHGDEKHRQWLLDEAEKFIALKRSSPPAPDGAPCERCSRAHPKEGWAYNWASGECFELADWAKPAPPAPDKQAAPTAECRLCGQTHWRPWTQSGFCPYMMS